MFKPMGVQKREEVGGKLQVAAVFPYMLSNVLRPT